MNEPNEHHTDSLEEYEEFGDNEFADEHPIKPPGLKARLADLWHNNPAFKVGVIGASVLALGGVTYAYMNNSAKPLVGAEQSRVGEGEKIKGTVGADVTPEYQKILESSNQQRAQQAIQNGQSAIPTPVGNIASVEPAKNETPQDPLAMWRQAEAPKPAPTPNLGAPENNQAQQQKQNDLTQLTNDMQAQIGTLMQAWAPTQATVVSFSTKDQQAPNGTNPAASSTGTSTSTTAAATPQPKAKVIVPAGDIVYGSMITEANSDVPGPILAQIMSGPLSGGRLIGKFQVSDDLLVIQFTVLSINAHTYAVDALALDPNTTLGGMATETDQRYFSRLVLPAAAAFISQFGQAISQPSQTTTVSNGTVVTSQQQDTTRQALYAGLGQSAQQLSNFVQQQGNSVRPLVRVASNTPIGIFFIAPVTDKPQEQTQ